MTSTSTNTTTRESISTQIARRYARAQADHEQALKTFTEAFANNPANTVEWNAAKIVATQTALVWWEKVATIAGRRSAAEAIAWGRDTAQMSLAGFFGSNSTCPWHNAARRVEAEVYFHLLNTEIPRLEGIDNEQP